MAARRHGAEKPHQGVSTRNRALHRGFSRCKSRNALGLRAVEPKTRVRSFCSGEQYDSDLGLYYLRARYYNPNTGSDFSQETRKTVNANDPASLHKYLYANGDPVNGIDPMGREELVDTGWLTKARVVAAVLYASACGWAIYDLYDKIDDALDNVYNMPGPSYDPHGHRYVPEWQVLRLFILRLLFVVDLVWLS